MYQSFHLNFRHLALAIATTICITFSSFPQNFLPPVMEWHGKSENLVVKNNHPWVTPAELSNFESTPTYKETFVWLDKLCASSPLLNKISIGTSAEGREIFMIVVSNENDKSAEGLKKSLKPIFLAQAGIHSGEIDGKDAGMMLLRDIAFGNKKSLLDQVNFLFIPILNVDGHENSSPYNRPNQRGPKNMGWRTNALNLNLNRDYTKLDTEGIRAVLGVINEYDPLLYMDIHVTDGADYQYDITFSGSDVVGNSPNIAKWLGNTFKPNSDASLETAGHIPGPLLFAANNRDFSAGNMVYGFGPRFSHSYGNLRHLATILVENHSLKPYRQRVLGTYVLLENTLKLLSKEGNNLRNATELDKNLRQSSLPTSYLIPQMKKRADFDSAKDLNTASTITPPDSLLFLGISSKLTTSAVTNSDYIEWLAKPETKTIANFKATEPSDFISRPKGYYIPASYSEVIERLKIHGIQMEIITEPKELEVEMYRIEDAEFGKTPYEGHMTVSGKPVTIKKKQLFPQGSAYISTDQPLGDLAVHLLEPSVSDSFFSWGFFLNIFQRTEYMESYVIEPMAKQMLEDSPVLKKEYEEKMKDSSFAKRPYAIMNWFYSKSPYYDSRYLLYPVGRVN
ncbi:M14 family metallopeptidase [Aegicerativicinus sediminis]|uniref:M14 family metallopeptidase n=1 Tax=Aegicerativicinus sediminis TaxID=2893202 RepID=UPI001E2BC80F|nr:M14 family metallopeptidase [Aegicerativicinus sediminis]